MKIAVRRLWQPRFGETEGQQLGERCPHQQLNLVQKSLASLKRASQNFPGGKGVVAASSWNCRSRWHLCWRPFCCTRWRSTATARRSAARHPWVSNARATQHTIRNCAYCGWRVVTAESTFAVAKRAALNPPRLCQRTLGDTTDKILPPYSYAFASLMPAISSSKSVTSTRTLYAAPHRSNPPQEYPCTSP
jgi:hypothetical protein